jgi:hypothetical protein
MVDETRRSRNFAPFLRQLPKGKPKPVLRHFSLTTLAEAGMHLFEVALDRREKAIATRAESCSWRSVKDRPIGLKTGPREFGRFAEPSFHVESLSPPSTRLILGIGHTLHEDVN